MLIDYNGVMRNMTPEEEQKFLILSSEVEPQEPTAEEKLEAQVLYTALMTDTLLGE